MSESLQLHGLYPNKLLCPWNFLGKNTGLGCYFLLQGIFLAQRLNLHLLHWQVDSLLLSHLGSLHWAHLAFSVQSSSVTQSCPTLCDSMNHSTPGLPVHHQLPEFTQTQFIESVMPSSHLILCRPLLLLPPILPSIRVFSNESTPRMKWPKYWSFSFNIISYKDIAGLISFRMDWLDLLAVQGTLKSLLQHHSSKYQFFSAQPSSQSNSHIHTWPQEKP